MIVKLQALIFPLSSLFLEKIELQKLEPCNASQRGSVGGVSGTATTTAAVEAGLRSSREIGTDCKNKGPRINQFFESKESKKLIGIYADWLED